MKKEYWIPIIIALVAGFIGLVYYFMSGQASFETNFRDLQNQENIENTKKNGQTLQITCKNGEKYEIIYKEGQTNFEDLIYNKCGSEGVSEES